jgi:hypothetical protein
VEWSVARGVPSREDRQTGRRAGRQAGSEILGPGAFPVSVAPASVTLVKPPCPPPCSPPCLLPCSNRRPANNNRFKPWLNTVNPRWAQRAHQDLSRIALAASSPQPPLPPSPVPQSPQSPRLAPCLTLFRAVHLLSAPLLRAKMRGRPVPAGVSAAGRSWPTLPHHRKAPKTPRFKPPLIPPALSFRSWALGAILIFKLRLRTQLACCFPFVVSVRCLCSNS